MRQVFQVRRVCFVLLGCAVMLAGCGGVHGVKVAGKLLKAGQVYAPSKGSLNLSFRGKGPNGAESVYPAKLQSDGSFVVDGPQGAGIPPGRYTITLNQSSEATDPVSLAKLKAVNSQFAAVNGKECEVTPEGAQTVTIDFAKGTVTH